MIIDLLKLSHIVNVDELVDLFYVSLLEWAIMLSMYLTFADFQGTFTMFLEIS